jgi:hypothetical protein
MFGPDVQRQGDGRVLITGMEPHVVWELTPAEQNCIRETIIGSLLRAVGIDPIDTVAEELAKGVVAQLATLGDNGTSSASLLPDPNRRRSDRGIRRSHPDRRCRAPVDTGRRVRRGGIAAGTDPDDSQPAGAAARIGAGLQYR